jgi:hypothetical protein
MDSVKSDEHAPAQLSRKIPPHLAGPWFTLALAAIILFTYILDLNTPLGVPVWLIYFIPLVLAFWSRAYFAVPTVFVVTLLFLVAGFVFSPPGIQTSTALFIRIVFTIVFVIITVVLWMVLRRKERAVFLQRS